MAPKSERMRWNLETEQVVFNSRNVDNLILASVVVLNVDLKLERGDLFRVSQLIIPLSLPRHLPQSTE